MRFFPALLAAIFFGLIFTWIIKSIFFPDTALSESLEDIVEQIESESDEVQVVEEVTEAESTDGAYEIVEVPPVEKKEARASVSLPTDFIGPKDFLRFYTLDGHLGEIKSQSLNGYFTKGEYGIDRKGNTKSAYANTEDRGGINFSNRIVFNEVGTYSFSAWVKPTRLNIHNTIMSQVTPGRDFNIKLLKSGQFQAHLARGSAYQFCTTDERLPLDKWTHVAATADGAEWNLYINGELKKSCPIKFLPRGVSGSFKIGAMSSGENFTGSIDDVIIYDRNLSSDEVKSLSRS